MFQMVHVQEPPRPQMSVGCDECVCMCVSVYEYVSACSFVYVCVYVCVCVCVLPLRFAGHFSQQQSRVSSDGYKGERRLEDRICHVKQVLSWISPSFCVFIPICSLRPHLASSVGLGCFSVTISD